MFSVLRGRRTRGVRATPLVNHPRQKGTVASDMVPLWNPLLPAAAGNVVLATGRRLWRGRSDVKRVQSPRFITAKPRAIGIRLARAKCFSPAASYSSVPSAFLREEGGARSVTEGACGTISLYYAFGSALSLTRFHRELPPGGSHGRETGRFSPRRMKANPLSYTAPLCTTAPLCKGSCQLC